MIAVVLSIGQRAEVVTEVSHDTLLQLAMLELNSLSTVKKPKA